MPIHPGVETDGPVCYNYHQFCSDTSRRFTREDNPRSCCANTTGGDYLPSDIRQPHSYGKHIPSVAKPEGTIRPENTLVCGIPEAGWGQPGPPFFTTHLSQIHGPISFAVFFLVSSTLRLTCHGFSLSLLLTPSVFISFTCITRQMPPPGHGGQR